MGGRSFLTPYNAVDDPLVDALISIHSVDRPRTQDKGGWLWRWGQRGAGAGGRSRPIPSPQGVKHRLGAQWGEGRPGQCLGQGSYMRIRGTLGTSTGQDASVLRPAWEASPRVAILAPPAPLPTDLTRQGSALRLVGTQATQGWAGSCEKVLIHDGSRVPTESGSLPLQEPGPALVPTQSLPGPRLHSSPSLPPGPRYQSVSCGDGPLVLGLDADMAI